MINKLNSVFKSCQGQVMGQVCCGLREKGCQDVENGLGDPDILGIATELSRLET